jgi:Micrococcal nuclease (thermonuclease) homologs
MRRIRLVALIGVVLLVALTGCTGNLVDEPATPEEPNTESTETTTTLDAVDGESVTVTVTRVIDGDTMAIEYPNGTEDTVRLLGVDTPETTLSRVSPDEFTGIPDTTAGHDHLFEWGEQATIFAEDELEGTQVQMVFDPDSDRRGYFGRLLVYLYVDGENFNERLLAEGYARMYDSQFSLRKNLQQSSKKPKLATSDCGSSRTPIQSRKQTATAATLKSHHCRQMVTTTVATSRRKNRHNTYLRTNQAIHTASTRMEMG